MAGDESNALRLLREDDASAVAGLFRTAFGDARALDAEEILSWLRNREMKPEWMRVLEFDGRVVGYGDVSIGNDEVAVDLAAPGYWEPFLDWVEHEGRAARVSRVRVSFPTGHELEEIAARRGYRLWRSAFTMEIGVADVAPEPPPLPPGIDLREYSDSDAEPLRAALNEAFAGDPFSREASSSYFREFFLRARGFDPSLWLLAWDGAEIAAFVLAFGERDGDGTLGWIHSLGVRVPWRRRGLGEALLRTAFARLRARGKERILLGVDTENVTGALRLYERVGMHVVQQHDNWVLRL